MNLSDEVIAGTASQFITKDMPKQTRKTWLPPEGKFIIIDGRKVFISKKEKDKKDDNEKTRL